MKIRLDIDGQIAIAALYDNATAREFATLLPLSLTLTDFARIERIAYLPRKLTLDQVEGGIPVQAGDLAYYVPWGNLAIFIEEGAVSYNKDLRRLGKVESGLSALQRSGPLLVRIERLTD